MSKEIKWHTCRPFNNKIEVVNSKTGKVVCTVNVEDFKSLKKAEKMAKHIATCAPPRKQRIYKVNNKRTARIKT